MPRVSRSRHSVFAKLLDDALQILGIADRLGETQFGARHLRRDEGGERFAALSHRLVEAQQHLAAKAQMQAGARLAGEMRHALDADLMQRGDGLAAQAAAPRPAGWQWLPRRGRARRCMSSP